MIEDQVISTQENRIVITQNCINMWVPGFKLPERFLQARAYAHLAITSLANEERRGADVQAVRDAYRHAANELDLSLWMFIMDEAEKLRPILEDLKAYPDLESRCLVMREKLRGLEDDLRSRDSVISLIAFRYGEIMRLLEDVFQTAKKMFATRTLAVT